MLNIQQIFLNDTIIVGTTLIFVLVTITFAIIYYRKIVYAKREYDDAKNIVTSFVITSKRSKEEHDQKINNLSTQIEGIHSTTERLIEQNHRIETRISGVISSVKSSFIVNKKIVEHLTVLKEEVSDLSKNQQDLQKKFLAFEEKYKEIPDVKPPESIREDRTTTVSLTETENQIIKFLLDGNPKSAPEVEKKISKTREHTARLMKKLWQEGFIERDTHRIPFTYRVNEKLKEKLEAKI